MTFEELLSAVGNGFPDVLCSAPIKNATSQVGKIVTIKCNRSWMGCAVEFPGLNYDVWFSSKNGTDKRTRYMNELLILPKEDKP